MQTINFRLGKTIRDSVGKPSFGDGIITAGDLSDGDISDLVDAIKKHTVSVNDDAPCCCKDGRQCVGTMQDGMQSMPRPSVGGGSVTAFMATQIIGAYMSESLAKSYEVVDTILNNNKVHTGIHVDTACFDAKFSNGRTGCGANDRAPQNVSNIYREHDAVALLCQTLLGNDFNAAYLEFTDESVIGKRLSDWNPHIALDVIAARDKSAVEILKSEDEPSMGHHEVLVVFNYVTGTTVDRDALVAETGQQVFNIDMWYIDKMARALASGPESDQQYLRLKHAMVAYQIGTYITLCDGSQRPLLITQAA